MDSPDNLTSLQPDVNELQAQVNSLRQAMTTALVLVLVLSGTANIALWRSWRTKRGELAQITQRVRDFDKWEETLAKNLLDYGRTHPDFSSILAKYRIQPPKSAAVAPKAASPSGKAPAPVPSAKKP